MINNHTRTLKLERGETIDLLILLASAYSEGRKWEKLHEKIKTQLDAQDRKDQSYPR